MAVASDVSVRLRRECSDKIGRIITTPMCVAGRKRRSEKAGGGPDSVVSNYENHVVDDAQDVTGGL